MTDYKGNAEPHVAGLSFPEYFAKILKSKDRIIRAQAKRIEALEGDVQRLRLTRETLNTQLALLSYKLQLATGDWDQNAAESKIGQSVSRLRAKSCHADKRHDWNPTNFDSDPNQSKESSGRVGQTGGISQREGDREFGKLGLELCDGLSHLVDRYAKRSERTTSADGNTKRMPQGEKDSFATYLDCDSSDEKCRNYIRNAPYGGLEPRRYSVDSGDLLQEPGNVDTRRDPVEPSFGEEDSLAGCTDDISISVGNSPCSSPVGFNVDEPSFCFEYQLEDYGLKEKPGNAFQSGFHRNPTGDGGNMSPVAGGPKFWSNMYAPFGVGKTADSLESQYHMHGYRNQGPPFWHFGLPSRACNKHVNPKSFLGASTADPNRGMPGCDCCIAGNVYSRGMGVCSEGTDKGPINEGPTRWKHGGGTTRGIGAYPLQTRFGRLGGADMSSARSSPIWKRKGDQDDGCESPCDHSKLLSELTESSEQMMSTDRSASSEALGSLSGGSDSASMGSGDAQSNKYTVSSSSSVDGECYPTIPNQLSERQKKRLYRIGLNLFNRKPERGIAYLVEHHFLESNPLAVAKFLISRKGLSKQMIGEYLGNLQLQFNMDVLSCFVSEINLSGLQIDEALRKFQSNFQMPGEAQKIERLMEAFARSYSDCNPNDALRFRNPDAIFLLAYAIVMLNTDLHNSSVKPDKKMKLKDFVRNFRGIDGNNDVNESLLASIYSNISSNPLQPANDHVTQVMKVDQMIIGRKPQLVLPHRRLICYCRLSEIQDPGVKPDRGSNQHLREVFLFNDMLMVTKLMNKKKNVIQYTYRHSFLIFGMMILLFETPYYKYGIQLASSFDRKVLMNFAAQDAQDRKKFIDDLQEAILEVNEMEAIRTQDSETDQMGDASYSSLKRCPKVSSVNAEIELFKEEEEEMSNLLLMSGDGVLKNNALCGSIVNINEDCRRLSSGSLDSGLPSTSSGSMGSVQDRTHSSGSKVNIYGSTTGKLTKSSQHLNTSEL